MPNEFAEGQVRLGFIYDGIEDSPHIAVQLERTPGGIRMSLPWNGEYNPEHQRWFVQAHWGDDPEQVRYRYEVPPQIAFVDPDGPVALVGCRASGHRSNLGFNVGIGYASIRFAVLGAQDASAYEHLNGLRSEVEGLGTWVGLRSLSTDRELDEDGRLATAVLRLRAPNAVRVGTNPRLEIRPSYRFGPGEHPDETVIAERMFVQTTARTATEWDVHLNRHFAIRDVVRLASWQRLNFVTHEAMRSDDGLRTLDGKTHGIEWRTVETALTGQTGVPTKVRHFDFTFHYDDVSQAGLGRWLKLHMDEARVLQPILKLLELEGASLEIHVAQLGMGLEALGYKLALEAGVSRRAAKDEPLAVRLARLRDQVKTYLPFDTSDWPEEIANAYNSVKHANRTLPPTGELLYAYRIGIQLFRAWTMTVLGVSSTRARTRLEQDQVGRQIAHAAAQRGERPPKETEE
ncbi:HEPN domain-containing protein [Mumia quercus]|uniref:ApeA N-terminal domain 1-containing protein n=1 Tax=Mumia quercus TaxID=2976125 RepID=UPI0021D25252|nr:HEPN domain-containing protein [Mumia quercus]